MASVEKFDQVADKLVNMCADIADTINYDVNLDTVYDGDGAGNDFIICTCLIKNLDTGRKRKNKAIVYLNDSDSTILSKAKKLCKHP